jgi:mRNA interferase YafQ
MRTISRAAQFKKDFKRIKANPTHARDLDSLLCAVLLLLVEDKALPESSRDHDLIGSWEGCRECHIKPDLLLIYSKPDTEILRLVRLETHSNIFRK